MKKCKRMEIQMIFSFKPIHCQNKITTNIFDSFSEEERKGAYVKLISRCKEIKKCKSKIRTTVHFFKPIHRRARMR